MRKLMIMLAAVAAAVTASAATVDWNYKITGEAGGSNTEFTGYTAYLVDATYYTGLSEVTAASITGTNPDTGKNNYIQSATLSQTGSSGKGASKKYIFSTGAQEYSNSSLVEGTTYNYYLVLVDAAGENYYAQAYNYTARGATATPTEGDITLDVPRANVTSGMTAFSTGGGGGGGDIPEPTSGLLLLVGGAMLALRRKQK